MTQSVALRAYLHAEQIYLGAADESKEETDALGIMDLVWNLLSDEDLAFLDSRGLMPGAKA